MARSINLNHWIANPPLCPLCNKRMEPRWDPVRRINILVCHRDRIAIAVTDPLVGKWQDGKEKIPCPNCGKEMRLFFTSTGFLMGKCPSCKCTIKGANADRKDMPGALKLDGVAPDLAEEIQKKEGNA